MTRWIFLAKRHPLGPDAGIPASTFCPAPTPHHIRSNHATPKPIQTITNPTALAKINRNNVAIAVTSTHHKPEPT